MMNVTDEIRDAFRRASRLIEMTEVVRCCVPMLGQADSRDTVSSAAVELGNLAEEAMNEAANMWVSEAVKRRKIEKQRRSSGPILAVGED
jgi:hypothetical protein